MIQQEVLESMNTTVGKQINGVVLMRDYKTNLAKNGTEYIVGSVQSGIQVQFKVWRQSAAFDILKAKDLQNVPVYIRSSVDLYNGVCSLVIDSVQEIDGFTADQFLPTKYNVDAYFESLIKSLSSRVSDKGAFIWKYVFENDEFVARFKIEFAARSHHDNCKGGLLAHTYKVLMLTDTILRMYPDLVSYDGKKDTDLSDLIYLGAVLHDIGKVDEMILGVYTVKSCTTHNYIGTEYISKIKDQIIVAYGEEWYYNLISIILQHHDEFGMPAKTVWAYLIHLIDVVEAKVTDIIQLMNNSVSGKICVDDKWLSM